MSLDPSNPEHLGEFLYQQWQEALWERRMPVGLAWDSLGEVERGLWRDVARRTHERFAPVL